MAQHRGRRQECQRIAVAGHGRGGAVGGAGRVQLRVGVVRGRAHGVPPLPHGQQPDHVRELPLQVRQEGEPLQPGRARQLGRGVPRRDAALAQPLPVMGGGAGGRHGRRRGAFADERRC